MARTGRPITVNLRRTSISHGAANPKVQFRAGQPAARDGSFVVSATSARVRGPEATKGWQPLINGTKSPLGPGGPVSATGGTTGKTDAAASEFIRKAANPIDFTKLPGGDIFSNRFNPLSSSGPLDKNAYDAGMGPVIATTVLTDAVTGQQLTQATQQLEPGGALGIAGRGGINNAAGWMGLMGPTGGFRVRGLTATPEGDYVIATGPDAGKIVNDIKGIAWSTESREDMRSLPLVENYTAARAKALSKQGKLDATWMVDSAPLTKKGESHTYSFTAPAKQFLNVLVVPADGDAVLKPSDFDLEIRDEHGKVLGNSIERTGSDWLQMWNGGDAKKLQVRVVLHESAHPGTPTSYRLIVDTATDKVRPDSSVKGDHQLPLGTVAVEKP